MPKWKPLPFRDVHVHAVQYSLAETPSPGMIVLSKMLLFSLRRAGRQWGVDGTLKPVRGGRGGNGTREDEPGPIREIKTTGRRGRTGHKIRG